MPIFEDDETTFAQLQCRIKSAIEALEIIEPSTMARREDNELIMESKIGNFRFNTSQRYVSEFALPNFYFHLSTGYCILRQKGVQIGAMDYLKNVLIKAE
jgi:hypothetical protein